MSEPTNLFADGEGYERLMGQWSRPVGAVFLDWLGLPKGLRWLDVGCGNGAFTEVLIARSGPASVIGIDPSEQQLVYARGRPGAKSAEFRSGSALQLPFADGSFDAAAMALVITFIPDPPKAVAEMARVVRPGGCVATYMWDIPGGGLPLEPMYVALQALGIPRERPHSAEVSQEESLRALWEQAGLHSIETRVIRIPVTFANFDDFWQSNTLPVGPLGKMLGGMSPAALEELRAAVRGRLPTDKDGRISYEAFANAVMGVRPA